MRRAHALSLLLLVGCVKSRTDEQGSGAASSSTTQPATVGLDVEGCERILVDAERRLAEARRAAATDCTTTEDCVLVESAACIGACSDRAIAKRALAGYTAVREELRSGSCKKWQEGQCPKTTPKPMPTCRGFGLACTDGKCVSSGPL